MSLRVPRFVLPVEGESAHLRGLREGLAAHGSVFPFHAGQRYIFRDAVELGRFLIFPKGRRFGFTQGAAWASIEAARRGLHVLWGDTVLGNIRRYLERYHEPACLGAGISYKWVKQDNTLRVGSGLIDFRSADNPGNWEGFGYDLIILNEAGIILDDPYLWHNAVLPMMIDHPGSVLIAGGTPKLTRGVGLLFKALWDRCEEGAAGYHGRRFSTYDNPHLSPEEIKLVEAEIAPAERDQEIHGKFVQPDNVGSFFKREWLESIPAAPELVRRVIGWDFAATEPTDDRPDPDWTVGVSVGITRAGREGIYDVKMGRTGPAGVDALLASVAKADPHAEHVIPLDPGSAGRTAFEHFRTGPLAGRVVHEYPQTRAQGPKATRATPVSIAAAEGTMFQVDGAWSDWFWGLVAAFPSSKVHDDPVDAWAAAHNKLTEGVPELFFIG